MGIRQVAQTLDEFQQRRRVPAFVFAVLKKFGDDQGGGLAALIAYYAFVSLFPLLLVLFTVLGFALHGHPGLQHDVKTSALADFPIIGTQISRNVTSVRGNGIGLAIGTVGTFWGGLGVAGAAQNAMNQIWEVPMRARPGFFPRTVRSLTAIGTVGIGIVLTTVTSGIGSAGGGLGAAARAAAIVVSIALNLALFLVAFRVLTARDLAWRDLLPGALFAAVAWEVLQSLGGIYVSHTLRGMSPTYGLFAIVLGLVAWLSLQAQVVVYAAEINVVRADRLWPRSLAPPPLTDADDRAYDAYARAEERRPEDRVDVVRPTDHRLHA